MAAAAKGSEAEFLQQVDQWKPCAAVPFDHAQMPNVKRKAGPSSRQASVAALSSSAAAASASRFFLYLEATPVDSAHADAGGSAASLRLTASNIVSVWSSRLDLAAFRRHRESLGIAAVGWKEVLAMLRACFAANRISLMQQDEESILVVTCRYTIGGEVELEGRFELKLVEELAAAAASAASHAALNAPQQLLSHLLFNAFSNNTSADSASLAPLQTQVASLRSEVTTLRSEVASLRLENGALLNERATWLGGSSSGGGSAPAGSSQHASFDAADPARSSQAAKRKPPPKPKNMSVLNPNSKRRKVGGIKLEG